LRQLSRRRMRSELAITSASIEARTIQKLRLRILPFVLLLFVVALIDRNNIGFAALTMNQELGITSQQFGLLYGIFFVGYFIFEIPSNLLLHRIGARVWITRILLSWGVVATLTGLVTTVHQLYVLRFLLGFAEAGYFPGMVLYLTYWFPQREQARAFALLLIAAPLTTILGAPVSGFILDHSHWLGVASWRWLLVLEGAPAIILAVLTYSLLPSRPHEAKFLTAEEKEWIREELGREERQKLERRRYSLLQAFASGRVWHLVLIYFGLMIGNYVLISWAPQLVKSLSRESSNTVVGLLLVIPSFVGLVAMIAVSRSSDRTLERRYHVAISALFASTALLLLGTTSSQFFSVTLLCLLTAGVYSYIGPFWALPSEFLTGYSAAAGIALINSAGNLGGLVGPLAIGMVIQRSGALATGLAFAAVPVLVAAALVLLLPRNVRPSAKGLIAPSITVR
jgi:MFS transporter, ACS family, tartrate transporter